MVLMMCRLDIWTLLDVKVSIATAKLFNCWNCNNLQSVVDPPPLIKCVDYEPCLDSMTILQ